MKILEKIGVFFFVVFLLWAIAERQIKQSDLFTNGKIVQTKIVQWNLPTKGSSKGGFLCEFDYNSKHYKLSTPTTFTGNLFKMVGKNFPGVFTLKIETFEILITPEDFEKFKMHFPDSLNKYYNQ